MHSIASRRRTGKWFQELHEWMDEPQKVLKIDHRRVRHDLSYIPEVKKLSEAETPPYCKKQLRIWWSPRKDRAKRGWEVIDVQ